MQIENLQSFPSGHVFEADLAIVGGGAAGLTIAREFFDTRTNVLVIESGELQEDPKFSALNAVESVGEPKTEAQRQRRAAFHGAICSSWLAEEQAYGVRCRVLGGSTHAWAGKSAAFDPIDFTKREWVPYSGWPFERSALDPFLERAAMIFLNLGSLCNDSSLWKFLGETPEPHIDPEHLSSFFWQFARSRLDKLDIMRFGPEFACHDAPNVRVLLNATAINIETVDLGLAVASLTISTIDGKRSSVRARTIVLAASGIENPRLLLASNNTRRCGLGNENDTVGRFLMDHAVVSLASFKPEDIPSVIERFGFYGIRNGGRTHMYMHGLSLNPAVQVREKLLNCALYMIEEHAADDPLNALKRLLTRRTAHPITDVVSVLSSPLNVLKAVGKRLMESDYVPSSAKEFIIGVMLRRNADFVAREYQSRGHPHKLTGLRVEGICEQRPDPESRITLSRTTDSLGVPLAKVCWRIGRESQHSLMRLAHLFDEAMPAANLPSPVLADWATRNCPEDSIMIDMGHTLGTTRMSENSKTGVVDVDCRVHGVSGLYIAGGSVFPTSGHANPTLMIVALAIRLADRIKDDLAFKRA